MISYKISYKVKKSEKNRIIGLIVEFIDGIRNNEHDTIIYHVYESNEPGEFMHIMTFKNELAERSHRDSSYYHKFMEELSSICESEPEYSSINLIR